ncbi:flagellar biosynthesis protein FlgG [Arenibaculum pallidiluteum]|uniref:flagellar biosynthesis protein FlgG n=1 Tax=Arenibaculum pallidiluteum TaxID=2812559 RepID=UPI001A96491E|nr:flagellar biosynthesis protein FlgG [Arenibaculum pallidiluteum]
MDIGGISLLKVAGQRLEYLAQRHQVIAENVVNANTPGYLAKDLKPFDGIMNSLRPVTTAQTDARHFTVSAAGSTAQEARRAESWEVAPDGNSVSLEQEMMKASETREAYTLVSSLYQKSMGMLRVAWSARGA